jgi:hypothetical protein
MVFGGSLFLNKGVNETIVVLQLVTVERTLECLSVVDFRCLQLAHAYGTLQ